MSPTLIVAAHVVFPPNGAKLSITIAVKITIVNLSFRRASFRVLREPAYPQDRASPCSGLVLWLRPSAPRHRPSSDGGMARLAQTELEISSMLGFSVS